MADDEKRKRREAYQRELDERRATMRRESDQRLIEEHRRALSREMDREAEHFRSYLRHSNMSALPDPMKLKILEQLHGDEKARAIAMRLGLSMRAGTPPRARSESSSDEEEESSSDEEYAGGHQAKRRK